MKIIRLATLPLLLTLAGCNPLSFLSRNGWQEWQVEVLPSPEEMAREFENNPGTVTEQNGATITRYEVEDVFQKASEVTGECAIPHTEFARIDQIEVGASKQDVISLLGPESKPVNIVILPEIQHQAGIWSMQTDSLYLQFWINFAEGYGANNIHVTGFRMEGESIVSAACIWNKLGPIPRP